VWLWRASDGFRLSGSYWFLSIEATTQLKVHKMLLGYWGNIYKGEDRHGSEDHGAWEAVSTPYPFSFVMKLISLSLSLACSLSESALWEGHQPTPVSPSGEPTETAVELASAPP
jgi:hypothetical protein